MATPQAAVDAAKRYDVRRYNFDDFDDDFCLRPPWSLLVVLLFICRDYLLPIAQAATRMGGGGGDMGWLLQLQLPFWWLLEIPGLLVAFAWVRRLPQAGPLARAAWTHGLALLLGSIALQAAAIVATLPRNWTDFAAEGLTAVGMLFALLVVAVSMLRNRRMRNAFQDFPAAH